MKKIVIHWSAGANIPSAFDKQFYHYLIDSLGRLYKGDFAPEANLKPAAGRYAMHCGGGNTGAIGVCLCGMAGFTSPKNIGKFPITKVQLEAAFELCARLCRKYNIKPGVQNVFTHYEFGLKNPNTSSRGKIDIIFLAPYPELKPNEIGNFIRNKIRWYLER